MSEKTKFLQMKSIIEVCRNLGRTMLLTCLSVAALFACKTLPAASATQPNVVIFLTDDLGYGDLGCYGNTIIKTPNIDALAEQGVRLTDCHSGGTVCSPSRAALLTGRNPYRSGFFYIASRKSHLRAEEITLAERLRDQGYETSFWGKWHLSRLEKKHRDEPGPGDQGFDYWMGTSVNAFEGPGKVRSFMLNGKAMGEVDGWYCDIIVDRACTWLEEQRDQAKPFFMYVSTHEPHTPIEPPAKYSKLYDNAEVDGLAKQVRYGAVSRPRRNISANKKEYYGTVTQLDAAFGRLMGQLKKLGLEENTVVIFTSDNGPETPVTVEESLGKWDDPIRDYCFGTPGALRGMKRFPYEGGHRVPGIVRFPGRIPAGSESDVLFNGTDFFPTICKLGGAEIPTDRPIDGINAFQAFLGKKVKRDQSNIWFYPHHEDCYFRMPHMSLRKGQHTLVGRLPPKADDLDLNEWFRKYDPVQFELYDVSKDPAQQNDIAEKKAEIVRRMKIEMIAMWRDMRDEGLQSQAGRKK